MKFFLKFFSNLPYIFVSIILLIFFKFSLSNSYTLASTTRNGEAIFKNVCAGCHVKGGLVISKGSKSLKFSDLEKKGIADIDSIATIANEGIGFMKGYKHKLKEDEDQILAEWIIQESKKGWTK